MTTSIHIYKKPLYFKKTCENHFSNFPYQSIGEIRQIHAMFSTRRPRKIWVAGTLTSLRGPGFWGNRMVRQKKISKCQLWGKRCLGEILSMPTGTQNDPNASNLGCFWQHRNTNQLTKKQQRNNQNNIYT